MDVDCADQPNQDRHRVKPTRCKNRSGREEECDRQTEWAGACIKSTDHAVHGCDCTPKISCFPSFRLRSETDT